MMRQTETMLNGVRGTTFIQDTKKEGYDEDYRGYKIWVSDNDSATVNFEGVLPNKTFPNLDMAKDAIDELLKKNESFKEMLLKHGNDPDENFDPAQLKMGIEIEKEHNDDPEIRKKIAKAHLAEFPDYYTHLKKMETEMKTSKPKSVAKKEQAENMLADIKHFLQKHPNPDDEFVHDWADQKGYDIKEVEATIYQLATMAAKKESFTEKIEKRGDKWVVLTKDGSKVLGTHGSEEDAKKQLAAIEISKHKQRLLNTLTKEFEQLESFKEIRYKVMDQDGDELGDIDASSSEEAKAKATKLVTDKGVPGVTSIKVKAYREEESLNNKSQPTYIETTQNGIRTITQIVKLKEAKIQQGMTIHGANEDGVIKTITSDEVIVRWEYSGTVGMPIEEFNLAVENGDIILEQEWNENLEEALKSATGTDDLDAIARAFFKKEYGELSREEQQRARMIRDGAKMGESLKEQEAKKYLGPGEKAPEGKSVKTGPSGGQYYETEPGEVEPTKQKPVEKPELKTGDTVDYKGKEWKVIATPSSPAYTKYVIRSGDEQASVDIADLSPEAQKATKPQPKGAQVGVTNAVSTALAGGVGLGAAFLSYIQSIERPTSADELRKIKKAFEDEYKRQKGIPIETIPTRTAKTEPI